MLRMTATPVGCLAKVPFGTHRRVVAEMKKRIFSITASFDFVAARAEPENSSFQGTFCLMSIWEESYYE
jgi:hypothetical protein